MNIRSTSVNFHEKLFNALLQDLIHSPAAYSTSTNQSKLEDRLGLKARNLKVFTIVTFSSQQFLNQ